MVSTLTVLAYSSDLTYIVAGNSLYKYNTAIQNYSSIYNLATFTNYKIVALNNRIVVWGWTPTPTNSKFSIVQTAYFLIDNAGIITTLATAPVTAYNLPTSVLTVSVSPLLTKVHYEYYMYPNNYTYSIVIHNINYDTATVTAVTLTEPAGYLATTLNIPALLPSNFFLGDNYLVVRNESGLASNSAASAIESTYQFIAD